MTTKLYWNDPHQIHFSAQVLETKFIDDATFLRLNQTAFYPLGGGQPSDKGTLNQHEVIDVTINDDGAIWHKISGHIDFALQSEIVGAVDWSYRLEMLQQHTGQHILSQAFWQLFGAETRGFRINPPLSEIDLALDFSADDLPAAIRRAEDLANAIVFENRPIRSHQLTPDQAAKLPLRKESFITDCVRVIEIADFDWSPCGGTHATATGEVGLIVVRGWERAKKLVRLKFLCGQRALADYRLANSVAENIARKFSGSREQATESVQRLIDDNKKLQTRNRDLAEAAAKLEAVELLATAESKNGVQIVVKIFTDRSFDELKTLAHRIAAQPHSLALLAIQDGSTFRLVFARSPDVTINVQPLMKTACELMNGKGGGTPDFAQGGGTTENIDAVFKCVLALI